MVAFNFWACLVLMQLVFFLHCKDFVFEQFREKGAIQQHFTQTVTRTMKVNNVSTLVDSDLSYESIVGSPYTESIQLPSNFHFEDFPSYHEEPLNIARMGVSDAFILASAAARALRRDFLSTSYHRYFHERDRDHVLAAFNLILRRSGMSNQHGEGDNVVNEEINQARDNDITIWWDDPVDGPTHCHDYLQEDGVGIVAYFFPDGTTTTTQSHLETAWNIVICHAIQMVAMKSLKDIPCSSLEKHATLSEMETVGRIILHEMFHAPCVAIAVEVSPSRTQIQDYQIFIGHDGGGDANIEPGGNGCRFGDLNDGDIVTAYGPFWSMFVNRDHGYGTWNADNYVWFAVEEFFREKCGIDEFEDPVRETGEETTRMYSFVVDY